MAFRDIARKKIARKKVVRTPPPPPPMPVLKPGPFQIFNRLGGDRTFPWRVIIGGNRQGTVGRFATEREAIESANKRSHKAPFAEQ